jgi:hypothetical protein
MHQKHPEIFLKRAFVHLGTQETNKKTLENLRAP